jgi:hypothetical protein
VNVEQPASNKYQMFSGKRSRSPILEIDSWMSSNNPVALERWLRKLLNSGLRPAIEPRARIAALPIGPAQSPQAPSNILL